MCTLDVMGYTPIQKEVIPFKVLQLAMENVEKEPTELNKKILQYVTQTCRQLVMENETFLGMIREKYEEFLEKPEKRLKDEVRNLPVFCMQLLTAI